MRCVYFFFLLITIGSKAFEDMITPGETRALRSGVVLSNNIHCDHRRGRCAGWLPPVLLVLFLLHVTAAAADPETADDAYLTGYLSALLERQLQWQPGSFRVETHAGIANITLYTDQAERARAVENALAGVQGLRGLQVRLQSAGETGDPSYFARYPIGNLFPPLLADPKTPQNSFSIVSARAANISLNAALVSIGGDFGFYRWRGKSAGHEWQIGIFAGVLSQFNLDAPSKDLVNTDYLIGFPLTFRHGTYSGRLRIFHQSSHLGDETILRGTAPARVDVDYEAVDTLLAKDISHWRVYAGGEYIFRRTHINLDRTSLLAGADYRGSNDILWHARLVGGVHVRWLQQRHWAAGTSLKIGLEFGQPPPMRRGSRLMLEAYDGYAPFGQFYTYDVRYYGLGYYIDF